MKTTVVIGGSFAGMTAALEIKRKGKEKSKKPAKTRRTVKTKEYRENCFLIDIFFVKSIKFKTERTKIVKRK
jgi:thioredoxin reductase